MKILRIVAVQLSLSLMIGELWRSWGVGRPIAFVLDDQIMGGMLLISAWLVGSPTPGRCAFFAASWGVVAGMLYGSFFNKVFAPTSQQAGNWDMSILTVLIGVAFVTSIFGMIYSIWIISKLIKSVRVD